MSSLPDPSLIDAAHGRRTELTVAISIPTTDLLLADRDGQAATLADAAYQLTQEEGHNKAVAVLLGSALDCAARGDNRNVALAVRAAVVVLQNIATAQLSELIA